MRSGSSLCLIRPGHKLKLYDLLTGMLMASGNDAAYTVAVTTARAVKTDTAKTDAQAVAYFSELMNSYASSIGMKDSHFTTPEGWDDASQYTTVSDPHRLDEIRAALWGMESEAHHRQGFYAENGYVGKHLLPPCA